MTVLLKRIAGAESGPNGPYLTTVRCNNTDTVDASFDIVTAQNHLKCPNHFLNLIMVNI